MAKSRSKLKREVVRKFGKGWEAPYFVWGETTIRQDLAKTIPVPPQVKGESFVEFSKKNATKLKREVSKLKGKPVVLTGGGGAGLEFAFMEGVEVECDYRPIRDERGYVVRIGNEWIPDKTKSKVCSVKVRLTKFDGKKFDPNLGSWKISGLKGYGAEKLSKKKPYGWEV